MADIPQEVLSEHLQERLAGRRVKAAVFLSFTFEPDFFEQEILPVIFDLPMSAAPAVRLLMLEDHLKNGGERLAVYYDRRGLISGEQSAKLDVRRIAMSYPTGYFHPKNVLLLTEQIEPTLGTESEQQLLVATLSANLTRAGWWENVECCHVEEIADGQICGFRDDLLDLIRRIKNVATEHSHEAIDSIRKFVLRLSQGRHRTANEVLHPRLYTGSQSVTDFLDGVLGSELNGLNLEIISPFFDAGDPIALRALQEKFGPRETRVFLPRADDGSALCEQRLFDAVRKLTDVSWGQLPATLTSGGKSKQAKRRSVHAKVYRFFDPNKRYEALLIGSVNLTNAAHSKGGNFETAFLVETSPSQVPEWWLTTDNRKPSTFLASENESNPTAVTFLTIRYHWDSGVAEALWAGAKASATLSISANGIPLFTIPSLPSHEWRELEKPQAEQLNKILASASFVAVSEDAGPSVTILVEEEGMAHKPSLLLSLSAADILRYWSLLTPEQRQLFIETRLATEIEGLSLDPRITAKLLKDQASMFNRFAGIFHAFEALERSIVEALEAKRDSGAEYRLLGKKYDSLPSLIDRVCDPESKDDAVTRYVILLSAQQLINEIARRFPDFKKSHRKTFRSLETQLFQAREGPTKLSLGADGERDEFLAWFEDWFLARAVAK